MPTASTPSTVENARQLRVIVIGAGYSGIYLGIRIPQRLRNVDLTIYEKNEDVGGTWFENRYPGCACDIPAHSYQFSFCPNPDWSAFYASAKEIHAYLKSVVEKYSVGRFLKCGHRVAKCVWNEERAKWKLKVEVLGTGEYLEDECDVLITARGQLNAAAWPEIPGLDTFSGPITHSAKWDDGIDFTGKRVGIIGSGSSAIQIVPQLQKLPGTHLSCFVRSKTWISPMFGTSASLKLGLDQEDDFTDAYRWKFKNDPGFYLRFRKTIEDEGNGIHALTLQGSAIQESFRAVFESEMKRRLARKPEILESLRPSFAVGCRRLTPGPGYLEALAEDNVEFVPVAIQRCGPSGLTLADGRVIGIDILVCATGFNTAGQPPFPVEGRGGRSLATHFTPHPESYLSLATDGFPNCFFLLGPNSVIGTGSLTMMIESFGDYIVKAVRKIQKENIRTMEVKRAAVRDFSTFIDRYFAKTVYLDDCRSWYRSEGGAGTRIVGLWPGSTLHCIEALRSPRWEDWDYEMEEGQDRVSWLGDGWSERQLGDGGDLSWYLNEGFVDRPAEPLPEETERDRLLTFSH